MIFLLFFLVPLPVGAVLEYLFCRLPKRRFWRYVPPAAVAVLAGAVGIARWYGWSSEGGGAPAETLIFFPGLPAAGLLTGLYLGWRLWKRVWSPRVVKDGKKPH